MRQPDSENSARRIGMLMRELMVLIGKSGGAGGLQALHRQDLTLPQIVSLRIMRDGGAQTVSALSGRLRLTPGAVSRLVDQLVEKRLVDRAESEVDRRQKVLELTSAGVRLVDEFDSARAAGVQRLVGSLEGPLVADLLKVLARVVTSLKEKQASGGDGSGGANTRKEQELP